MQRTIPPRQYFTPFDLLVLLLIGGAIYGCVIIGQTWNSAFTPVSEIDLSPWALPRYAFLSTARGLVAYVISLIFTLVVGYAAARAKRAELVLVPALDILQSIPVLGFLPGLVLGLIAIFPNTNIGLELAAVIMIFTGQVWNMTFSFYFSLKSIPGEYIEAARMMGLDWKQRLVRVELPYAAVDLTWNSLLSMAGGWFFLSVCEAFHLGKYEFRLPGIGAYMDVAIREGNTQAMILGVVAMALIIIVLDFIVWRPILIWVQRFRLEPGTGASAGDSPTQAMMRLLQRESQLIRWWLPEFRNRYRRFMRARALKREREGRGPVARSALVSRVKSQPWLKPLAKYLSPLLWGIFVGLLGLAVYRLVGILSAVRWEEWIILVRNTVWTLMRVLGAAALGTLWAVPFGIWVGTSNRRIRIAQPLIQVLASFPAPMLYPLALSILLLMGLHFEIGSMFLIMLGVQWYVLFNVLAGTLRIPAELRDALEMMNVPRWERWKRLYLPSVFPSLVTGWVTAVGGAWNASIVAEYIHYGGRIYNANGLGAMMRVAASNKDFPMLAASLTLMVSVVVIFNRTIWARLFELSRTRYRMN